MVHDNVITGTEISIVESQRSSLLHSLFCAQHQNKHYMGHMPQTMCLRRDKQLRYLIDAPKTG